MMISVTLGEISSYGDWESFCKLKGYSYYCMNEGLASREEVVELTIRECCQIGLDGYIEREIQGA